ncbi:MAG: pyridoxamine 5'-phosphate oxidase family protein [Saprospiraceae bacterium]
MGKIHASITDDLKDFVAEQKMFFVATAPLTADGFVNLSPKGLNAFRILDEKTVAYLDLTGSGAETIAHLSENQRITIMFCAFTGRPNILRFYGKGRVLEKGSAEFNELYPQFNAHRGARSIIVIDVTRIADSCGYSVPKYEFVEDRDVLDKWCERKSDVDLIAYREKKNSESLDGLPAFSGEFER